MNNWINYHHLYYFKTIAEEGSVSSAAEKLRLGQPTLSSQLKLFEENLGVILFTRKNKRLILTEQGKIALEYAHNIFRMGNEMYEVLKDRITPSRVHLQVGALDSISKQVILVLTMKAHEIAPCSVTLMEGKFDEMIRELSAHRIDVLVSNFLPKATDMKGFFYKVITKDTVSLYGSSAFKSLKKNFPSSISGKKFVLPTYDSKLRQDIEHWAHVNHIFMDIVAETQDTSLIKLMALEGLGLIPASSHSVAHLVESGLLVELGPLAGIYEELFFITAERKIKNEIASTLMKEFQLEKSFKITAHNKGSRNKNRNHQSIK